MKSSLPHTVLQIAIVVNDLEKHLAIYAKLFGVEKPATFMTGAKEEAQITYLGKPTEGRARFANIRLKNVALEFIEPIGGPSVWQAFLDEKGDGIHHIAFIINGMTQVISDLEGFGLLLQQKGKYPGGRYAYLQGIDNLGFYIELLEGTV